MNMYVSPRTGFKDLVIFNTLRMHETEPIADAMAIPAPIYSLKNPELQKLEKNCRKIKDKRISEVPIIPKTVVRQAPV